MRTTSLVFAVTIAVAACHSAPPPPPPAPTPLSDSAVAALDWVQTHAAAFSPNDSVASAEERSRIFAITSGARVIGFSELTEGSHEFPYVMRRALLALADSGVRGVALQTSMADAMEVDRYVRGGSGDIRRLLRTLNPPQSERIATRETMALVEALRAWNAANPSKQIGFYGFEIPTASHAIETITTLPDSVLGKSLKSWLVQRYQCVTMNEGAHWGLEGRAADSTFWNACAPATTQALDSIVALRRRAPASHGVSLAYAEEMARLIQHHVSVGLRHLARQEGNAEHVMFLLNMLGPNARLVLWGGDVEAGRLTLDKTTVQTGVALGDRLKSGYRAIAFTIGDGQLRARVPNFGGRSGDLPGLSNATIAPPDPGTYEDVFIRANPGGYWLDLRSPEANAAGAWLKGPHPIRLITETYFAARPGRPEFMMPAGQFETPVAFPANYDAVVFVKHATAAKPD
jgi:erythromycin esterase-like protein